MSKKIKVSITDQKYIGDEPFLTEKSTSGDLIEAYNWYNYVCDTNDAVEFILEYLKSNKVPKNILTKVTKIDPFSLRTIGWNCRILSTGGHLPKEDHVKSFNKLQELLDSVKLTIEDVAEEPHKNVISIQERIKEKTVDVIGTLEEEIDKFCLNKSSDFDPAQWFRENNIKSLIASRISQYYQPLYSEIYDALHKEDDQLKEYYHRWKKADLKKYAEFVKNIITAAETTSVATKMTRKPRKKKQKPAGLIIKKLKYKEKDNDLNITSINPATLVGSDQLWTYNTKSRTLAVYNSLGPVGLSVKGTTITGYDEKTSITKKLRKPEDILPRVLEGGKLVLRKVMDEINTKSKEANGRINTDTILLRTIK